MIDQARDLPEQSFDGVSLNQGRSPPIRPMFQPLGTTTAATRGLQCAGINRHEAEDESSLRERSSDPVGLESCAGYREVHSEA